jgi:hypothetical protein
MRSAATAVTLTNATGADLFQNCAFHGNATAAISSAATVTKNCLFDSNTADYKGGGARAGDDFTGTITFVDLVGGDRAPTDLSGTRDTGIFQGFPTDIRGITIPQGPAPDVGPYEFFVPETIPPDVTGAVRTTASTVRVSFSEAMDTTIASLVDPASWGLVDNAGQPVAVDSIAVDVGDASVVLSVAEDLERGMRYTITAPADLKDLVGNVINVRAATFSTPWTAGRMGIRQVSGQSTVRVIEGFELSPETAEV